MGNNFTYSNQQSPEQRLTSDHGFNSCRRLQHSPQETNLNIFLGENSPDTNPENSRDKMKPFRVGRIVINPLTGKDASIIHVTDKGVYLRDLSLPANSDAYDFIPAATTAGMRFTIKDIK